MLGNTLKINPISRIGFSSRPQNTGRTRNAALEQDTFCRVQTETLSPREYICKRLCALQGKNGAPLVTPILAGILASESYDPEGVAGMVGTLRTDILENLDWRKIEHLMGEDKIDFSTVLKNCRFLNSIEPEIFAKIENPYGLLTNEDFHFRELKKALSEIKAKDENIATISIKAQSTGEGEHKNVIRCDDNKGELVCKETLLFDEKGKMLLKEFEKIKIKNGRKISSRTIDDYRHSRRSLAVSNFSDYSSKKLVPVYEFSADAEGNYYKYKSPVEGVMNAVISKKGATPVYAATAEKAEDGSIQISKDIESFGGVKTKYSLQTQPNGDRTLIYKIEDKDGNVLMAHNSEVERIADNIAVTRQNGKTYTAILEDDVLIIRDESTDKESPYQLEYYINTEEDDVKDFLLTLEAPMLMKFFTNTNGFIKTAWCHSHFDDFESFDIHSDLDVFNFSHELGHAIDCSNGIPGASIAQLSSKEEFLEVYREELNNFTKHATFTQRDYLCHGHQIDTPREAFADAVGLLNYYQSHGEVSARTEIFQQHFPKTIAKVHEMINRPQKGSR